MFLTEITSLSIFKLSLLFPLFLFLILNTVLYFYKKSRISEDVITTIGAGLLMSLAFIDYIPKSLELTSPIEFSSIVLSTLIALLLIETHIIPRINLSFLTNSTPSMSSCHAHHHHFSQPSSFSAVGCLFVCAFFDGVKVGSGYLIGSITMTTTFIGTLLHMIPEGIVVLHLSNASRLPLKSSLMIQGFWCGIFGLGIGLTGWISKINIPEGFILSVGTATFIYVIFIHLLPVSFVKKNQLWFLASLILTTVFLNLVNH